MKSNVPPGVGNQCEKQFPSVFIGSCEISFSSHNRMYLHINEDMTLHMHFRLKRESIIEKFIKCIKHTREMSKVDRKQVTV